MFFIGSISEEFGLICHYNLKYVLNQLIVQNNVFFMFMLNIFIKNNWGLQFKLDAKVKLFQTWL